MTPDEKQKLKALIVATAMYYGHEIEDTVLSLYVEDLEDLEFPAVARAIGEVRRDPKTTRFPLPAVIRDRIAPVDLSDADAKEAASRIVQAVAKFGWCNPNSAQSFIGELGWFIVQRQGGWLNVCQMTDHRNLTSLQAQWRDLGASIHRRALAGTLHIPPALPAPRHELDSPTMKILEKSPENKQREKLDLQLEQLVKMKEMPK